MAHTPPPLRIGCKGRKGYALPNVFCREKGEPVEVKVESDCVVKFDDHKFFDVDRPYRQGETPNWTLLVKEDGTARYSVQCTKHEPSEGTPSIKLGSGRQRATKTKVKSKKTGTKKGTRRKAKAKKKTR